MNDRRLIFEKSEPGRKAIDWPSCDVPDVTDRLDPKIQRKQPCPLPQVSEPQLVRHYTNLSTMNFGVDANFYPLGSCTMKYNPKINDAMASMPSYSDIHPLQPTHTVQGCMAIMYELQQWLCEIAGMDAFSLQPAAGAQGEIAGLMMIKDYMKATGQAHKHVVLVPDSSHGTNPASAAMASLTVKVVPSDKTGQTDINALESMIDDETAGLMLTNPNTLGVFEQNMERIASLIHDAGGLLYYDGANANAIVGITRPGDMGFDIVHFNLHKTFSTPHGGGGPGSGPVGVKAHLAKFLPGPLVEKHENGYRFSKVEQDGMRLHAFYGNFSVLVRAYCYILSMGEQGLRAVAQNAVLNANYLLAKLKPFLHIPYDKNCMHEFVVSFDQFTDQGITAKDAAKRLIDCGIYPPTMYFPLNVKEALMIEPTETESKETLDDFIKRMEIIAHEAVHSPKSLQEAPMTAPVRRPDEVTAARKPIIRYQKENS